MIIEGSELVADEIIRQIQIYDHMYLPWQNEVWNRAKVERPALTRAVLDARDKIDEEFVRYKAKRSRWEDIEKRVDDYAETWRRLSMAYPL